MVKLWEKEQIDLLLDLFRRVPPVINPQNIPHGNQLKRYIDDFSVFRRFKNKERTFYDKIKRYAKHFRDDEI